MKHVIYHDHCADGFASAFAAWLALGDTDTRYIPMPNSPRTVPEGIGPDDEVWVLDYSFSRADLLALHARVKRLVVIDHHESMRAEIADLPFVIFDLEHSGCTMTWRHFHSQKPLPWTFQALEHRDLGRMWDQLPITGGTNEEVAAVHAALMSGMDRTFGAWNFWFLDVADLIHKGIPLVRQEQAMVQRACAGLHTMIIQGDAPKHWRVPAVNCPVLQSEIGHELLQRFPEAPFVVVYFVNGADGGINLWQYSMRARKNGPVNLAQIAKGYGGGGHPQAAGFTVPFLLPTNVITAEDHA